MVVAQRRDPHDTAAPLRRDVRLLGTILGNVLVEQEGEWLLELVERIRRDARSARGATAPSCASIRIWARASRRSCCARSASTSSSRTSPSSITDCAAGVRTRTTAASRASRSRGRSSSSASRRRARARRTTIRLVLTAHPTEATRRTVLLAHIRIAVQLRLLDDPRSRRPSSGGRGPDRRGGDAALADGRGAA